MPMLFHNLKNYNHGHGRLFLGLIGTLRHQLDPHVGIPQSKFLVGRGSAVSKLIFPRNPTAKIDTEICARNAAYFDPKDKPLYFNINGLPREHKDEKECNGQLYSGSIVLIGASDNVVGDNNPFVQMDSIESTCCKPWL